MEFIFDIDVIKALNIYFVVASSLIKTPSSVLKILHLSKIKFLYTLNGFWIYYFSACFFGGGVSFYIPEPCFNYCHFVISFIV